jgi:hypothetical protein
MHSYVITRAAELSTDVEQAQGRRALEEHVGAFVEVLECLPDYPAAAFSEAAINTIRVKAERVIDRIEQWVEADRDSAHHVRLVAYVYAIRRALEEMERWRMHYLASTASRSAER